MDFASLRARLADWIRPSDAWPESCAKTWVSATPPNDDDDDGSATLDWAMERDLAQHWYGPQCQVATARDDGFRRLSEWIAPKR